MSLLKELINRGRDVFSTPISILNNDHPISEKEIVFIKASSIYSESFHKISHLNELKDSFDNLDRERDDIVLKAEESTIPYIYKRYDSIRDDLLIEISKSSEFMIDLEDQINQIDTDIEKAVKKEGHMKYLNHMKHSLNRKRDTMPQIQADHLDELIIHFQGKSPNTNVKKVTKKISELKPSQSDISEEKVLKFLKNYLKGDQELKDKYVISKDGFLIDGHHNWSAALEVDPEMEVTCYKISLPIKELLRRTNLMKISKKVDIKDKEIKKAIDDHIIEVWKDEFDKSISDSEIKKVISKKVKYAVALIYNSDGKLLLTLRSKDDTFAPSTWCLPGGNVEDNETALECIKREVKEETNLSIKDISLNCDIKVDDGIISYFNCIAEFGNDPIALLDSEHEKYAFMSEDEWIQESLILSLGDHLHYIMHKNSYPILLKSDSVESV